MATTRLLLVLCVAFGLLGSTHRADAAQWPNAREGFMLGFNLGAGGAKAEFEAIGIDFDTGREGGGAGNFRFGYAASPNVVLGLEATGWGRTYDVLVGPLKVGEIELSFGVVGPSVAWYPGDGGGFFLRGTLGVGVVNVKATNQLVTFEADDSGFGGGLAVGYEFRLTRKFALTPQLDIAGANLGDVEVEGVQVPFKVSLVNLTLGFNWFF